MARMLQPRAHEHHEGRRSTAVPGVERERIAVSADQTAESEIKSTEVGEIADIAEREFVDREAAAVEGRTGKKQLVLGHAFETTEPGMGGSEVERRFQQPGITRRPGRRSVSSPRQRRLPPPPQRRVVTGGCRAAPYADPGLPLLRTRQASKTALQRPVARRVVRHA